MALGTAATKAKKREDGSLALEFVMNGSEPDRGGDVVHHEGGRFDNFLKNPVMPWGHDYYNLPLGHWENLRVRKGSLLGLGVFSSAAVWDFAAVVASMYEREILRAVSIGFLPTRWAWAEDRRSGAIDFYEYDLLECSAVMIGQHQDALATLAAARGAGIDLAPVIGEAERVIQLGATGRGWLGLSDARRVVDELRAPVARVDLGASEPRRPADPEETAAERELRALASLVDDELSHEALATGLLGAVEREIETKLGAEICAVSGELHFRDENPLFR